MKKCNRFCGLRGLNYRARAQVNVECAVRTKDVKRFSHYSVLALLAAIIMVGLFSVTTVWAKDHVYICDPASKNNVTLQACVDGLKKGRVLELGSGTWEMAAPVNLRKSMEIRAHDPSNRPILHGIGFTGGESSPFSRAFQVTALMTNVNGLTIKQLKFKDFSRPIVIEPEVAGYAICANGPVGTGKLRNVLIQDNDFEDSQYHVFVQGGNIKGVTIDGNRLLRSHLYGIRSFGGAIVCDDGVGDDIFGFGLPENLVISNNDFTNSSYGYDVDVWDSPGALIKNNHIHSSRTAIPIALTISEAYDYGAKPVDIGSIIGNDIEFDPEEAYAPILVSNYVGVRQAKSLISNNIGPDNMPLVSGFYSVIILDGVNNMEVSGNSMETEVVFPYFGNIFLSDATYNNTVIVEDPATVVQDYGTNNTVLVEGE